MDALARDIRLLPKAHLHVHLEGAMRRETVLELSERHGLPPPRLEGDGSFAAFVEMYRAASSLLTSPDDYQRVVFEVAQDAAEAGAVWVEPAVWLTAAQAAKLGLADEQASLEMLIDAAERAQATLGTGVGFIVQTNRTRPPEEAVALARLASRYAGRGVVAFGLADDEARAGPEPFAEAFAIARSAGLISAPHAGELAGAASVAVALDRLRAQRIQHGVRAIEDPRLIARLARDGVCAWMAARLPISCLASPAAWRHILSPNYWRPASQSALTATPHSSSDRAWPMSTLFAVPSSGWRTVPWLGSPSVQYGQAERRS